VAQGVSQCGPEVTRSVAVSLGKGISSVCAMAHTQGIDAVPVDIGMVDPATLPTAENQAILAEGASQTPDVEGIEGVLNRQIGRGTGDISCGPAMTRAQAIEAIQVGIDLVGDLKAQGYTILASGEMGIGNTTTSSAMTAALFGMPVAEVTGRGAGLDDEGLKRKVAAIERALEVNKPDASDPIDVLSKLGGFDIAGITGLFIGGAIHRVPIIIDGFISALSAYTAYRLCPECRCAMLASHMSAEPAALAIMNALELQVPIQAGMRLGEGTGAVCLVPLLDMALSLYNGTTFDDSGIEAYEKLS
jgi:nicotinate-nucleotide--dimethylbenzimidazole phosphoribosyltransferase